MFVNIILKYIISSQEIQIDLKTSKWMVIYTKYPGLYDDITKKKSLELILLPQSTI